MAQIVQNDDTQVITTDAPPAPAAVAATDTRAAQTVYLVLSIVEILLAFRLVLRLLGANSANAFVSFVYALTYPLIYPFIGIFALPRDLAVASFETATLVAMLVYAVIAYIIVALIRIAKTSK